MHARNGLTSVMVALALALGTYDSLSAQVVERRESEANPAAVIFRATLFGAGTGLVLGGAYALVESGDTSTGDILKWGVAGGAAAGAVIGLIYWATRSQPEGSAEEIDEASLLRFQGGDLSVAVPALEVARLEDVSGRTFRTVEASLLQLRF